MAGTTTPRKRAARSATVTPTPRSIIDAGRGDDIEPLRFTRPDKPVVDRVTIAYLDDDYALTMPRSISAGMALKIMRTSRKQGNQGAMVEMLELAIGEDGYTRLADQEGLTDEDLADLFAVVQKVAMGSMETPKASSKNG